MAYLSEKSLVSKPYLGLPKEELASELAMPKRTLDKILSKLREENKIFYKIARGRNGRMTIASIKALFTRVIQLGKEMRLTYLTRIAEVFGLNGNLVEKTFRQLSDPLTPLKGVTLSKIGTG